MTIEKFWKDNDKDNTLLEYGNKLLVTKQAHTKLSSTTRWLHKWYYLACACGLQFIEGRILEMVFKNQSFDLNIELFRLHTIY
jgi:hypothetical protein